MKHYKQESLKKALDLVEEGYSYSQVLDLLEDNCLNKSILAREMRKRKNNKAGKAIDAYYSKIAMMNEQE
ncbi:MAG: hypothetical protein AB9856_01880 [Cellulosilyticaceae bacterium]